MHRGTNMPAVGTYNQTLVLDLIRRSISGLSRVELAERTGLSSQTVSNVTRRLVDDGFIIEGERIIEGKGKPRTLLHLNARARFAVGVHLDPAVDTFVLVDLTGRIVSHVRQPPASGNDAELIAVVASTIDGLLGRAGVRRRRVLGIGAALPGPLDAVAGRVLAPPLLPQWHDVPVRDLLSKGTGFPVMLEKDVVAAMVGELWVDAEPDLTDALLVYYGAGVGVGMSQAGAATRGRTGNAGDIAHLVVEEGGPLCPCGLHGCLGPAVAPERVISRGLRGERHLVGEQEGLAELARRAQGSDVRAVREVERIARAFARAIVLTNNLLDVREVIVGGPSWSLLAPVLTPAVRTVIPAIRQIATIDGPRVVDARLGVDLAAAGAACLVLDAAFSARPSSLMIGHR